MRVATSLAGCCVLAMFAGAAPAQTATTQTPAATVEPVQGDLSLNRGAGFQKIESRVQANVGDSVMVGAGGAANLVYSDGCQVNIQPGSVVSITPLSPCASGSLAQDGGFNTGAVVGTALFVAGVGLGVYGYTQAKGQAPISP